ncbi:MAG: ABC transporter permease [Alphaproteobacteria bacterium]|nr:ABC transporter permease [Alphaproteobacteria bacterium]
MLRYLTTRCLYAVAVIVGVSVLVFFLVRLGGDPTALFLPPESSAEEIAKFRKQMGFDRPLAEQYLDFAMRALQGDFGRSLRHQDSALPLVLERLPATAQLAGVALALAVLFGVPTAIYAATRRDSLFDRASLLVTVVAQSFPTFWLGIMLILVFSEHLGWLPPSGRGTIWHLLMPATALAAYSTALITRLLRASMLEVMQADYVRTARGKGLSEKVVVLRHALRNAAIPAITVIGLQVGALLGGAVITEEIFAYPGMGRLAIQAISNRDFAVVQAFVVLMALIVVTINLCVDVAYSLLDPRIRLS